MIPQWDFWIINLILLILATSMMSKCVVQLRFDVGKKWIRICFLVSLYLACMLASLGLNFMSSQSLTFAKELKNPPELCEISKDWGADISKEKRTQYSLTMAKFWFVNGGKFRNYIDLNGTLRTYEPTAIDRQKRLEVLQYIKSLEFTGILLLVAAIGWLLIPLLGVSMGFSSWSKFKLFPNSSFKRDA